jgi:HEAT repeat protein
VIGRTVVALLLALAAMMSACASAPPLPPKPPEPSDEQKMSWILRFEDQRILRDPLPAPPPVDVAVAKQKPPVIAPPPPPDLLRLLNDGHPRIRRRASLAVGRVGLREGIAPLAGLLADPEPEVREMAAFGLGLIGDVAARDPLITALGDESLLVRGSAAEALGLIGDATAADAIARMARDIVNSGALPLQPDASADVERATPAGAFRLAIFALARLDAYPAIASVVLDAAGQLRLRWWPVAYALQRVEEPAAAPALRTLAAESHTYTRVFAIKGLGATKDQTAVPLLRPLVTSLDRLVAIEAIRALGRIGDSSVTPALVDLLVSRDATLALRLECIAAMASLGGNGVADALIDFLGDPNPAIRAAALEGLARLDPEGFMFILSGLDPDPHWSVRVALARALGSLPHETGLPRLRAMLSDADQRVVAGTLRALGGRRSTDVADTMIEHLKADDPVVRAAAAAAIAELRPPEGIPALIEAYAAGRRDSTYVARAAAIAALAAYKTPEALRTVDEALSDPDWAVRVRAAQLLREVDPTVDVSARIRPAPSSGGDERYNAAHILNPPFSTELHIETDDGTIRVELAVLDAPQAVENIVTLARKGFYNGLSFHRVVPGFVVQTGDPRGDGEGGPGYTIRDELNERPYMRGTVGMALDWEDTGGSQFFVTESPQPHLDSRYTVIGRVTSGMEMVERIAQWDEIRSVRVWDGTTFAELQR